MKKILIVLLSVFIVSTISAQNHKVRVGLFKKWYVGAFEEVIGQYTTHIDTISDESEIYTTEEFDDDLSADEYYDNLFSNLDENLVPLTITIKRDTIFYDNEIFPNVFTLKAKPKLHYYYIVAENNNNRIITFGIYPDSIPHWQIRLSDNEKDNWDGIWERKEIEVIKEKQNL